MSFTTRVVQRIWFAQDAVAAVARAALWPLERTYAGVVATRQLLYDTHVLPVRAAAVPTITVGNLTVGGTGKTPVAAWIAARLRERARPAIVLRGYGDDEIEVHRRLNPAVPVIAAADRAMGIEKAAREHDADLAVLDDAFQHRRVARIADVVLVSAEQVLRGRRLLPAGPWREPLRAAARADLVILTVKSAGSEEVRRAAEVVRAAASEVPMMRIRLTPYELVDANDPRNRRALGELRGKRVHAIAAIGEPELFAQQLRALGADVFLTAFPDHHAFSDADVAELAQSAASTQVAFTAVTLKDAVKLAARWPAQDRLWYVSQQLQVEQGQEHIDRLLQRVLDARNARATTSARATGA